MARTISDEEQRLLALIEAAWAAATGGRYALKAEYPIVVSMNGVQRRMAVWKAQSGGPLHFKVLDQTKYGPEFTVYKASRDVGVMFTGTINLFAMTQEACDGHLTAFNGLFEQTPA